MKEESTINEDNQLLPREDDVALKDGDANNASHPDRATAAGCAEPRAVTSVLHRIHLPLLQKEKSPGGDEAADSCLIKQL